MKVYEFGDSDSPAIFLFPGTCCHWKINFGTQIPLLTDRFRVCAVSYDGFDETEDTVFPDMIRETEKLEDYIRENYGGNIFAAYGCSLGGSFVSLLVQRKKIHIDHAIIGSSDLDQDGPIAAWFKTRLVGLFLPPLVNKGKLPSSLQKGIEKKPAEEREYYEKMLSAFTADGKGLPFVKKKSMLNQFYSDLVTPLEDKIDVPGTVIHVFYAEKMGKEYEQRYLKHYKDPVIHRFDLQHEELLFTDPERWAEEVKKACGI